MEYRYQIGDKTYVQKTLVLGQIEQMIGLVDGLLLPQVITPATVIAALGERLYQVLAVALTEEGRPLKDKDLEALGRELKWTIEPETAVEAISDFFDCNPTASLSRMIGKVKEITGKIAAMGSGTWSAPSPRETSPGETPSSGGLPPESAPPI